MYPSLPLCCTFNIKRFHECQMLSLNISIVCKCKILKSNIIHIQPLITTVGIIIFWISVIPHDSQLNCMLIIYFRKVRFGG